MTQNCCYIFYLLTPWNRMCPHNLLFQDVDQKNNNNVAITVIGSSISNLLHVNLAAIHVMFCSFLHRFLRLVFLPEISGWPHTFTSITKTMFAVEKKREMEMNDWLFLKCNKTSKYIVQFSFFVCSHLVSQKRSFSEDRARLSNELLWLKKFFLIRENGLSCAKFERKKIVYFYNGIFHPF